MRFRNVGSRFKVKNSIQDVDISDAINGTDMVVHQSSISFKEDVLWNLLV